jgi:peptidoglycan/LPS O-acetylase OafA/YrhL
MRTWTQGNVAAAADAYKPQLDGLRAFAVGLVIYSHFWNIASIGAHWGVRLFFVLSGYLITGILLRSRALVEARRATSSAALANFYARRALRIFPAYYAIVIVAYALDLDEVRSEAVWHLTYTTNFLFARQGYFSWATAHLWSLSVEEQFYLVWPFLILFVPRRLLLSLIAAIVVGGIMFRVLGTLLLPIDGVALYVLTPASLDALAAGALLAAVKPRGDALKWILRAGAAAFGLLLLIGFIGSIPNRWWPIFDTVALLPLAALVIGASAGFRGALGGVLSLPAVRYIGHISYGIYLYHLFIAVPILAFAARIGIDGHWRSLLQTGAAVAIAAASWRWLEQPFNRLKPRFEWPATASTVELPATSAECAVRPGQPSSGVG